MAIGLVTSLGVSGRPTFIDGRPLTDRKVRILIAQPTKTVGDTVTGQVTQIDDLQVTFDVEKTLGKGPNSASVAITNLAGTTRAALQEKGALFVVQAGYEANIATIFKGDVRTIEHIKEPSEWKTKIKAGDGDRAYQFARVSENFPAGSKVGDVLRTVADPMSKRYGIEMPDFNSVPGMGELQYANGYVAVGRVSKEMDRILVAAGYEWSIQDGRLQILKPGVTPTQQVVHLSSDSGLVGSPEYCAPEKKGKPPILKFKALLSPQIFPGGLLSFSSLRHKGIHLVKKCKHTGDTDGGNWFTEGECEIAEAAVAL